MWNSSITGTNTRLTSAPNVKPMSVLSRVQGYVNASDYTASKGMSLGVRHSNWSNSTQATFLPSFALYPATTTPATDLTIDYTAGAPVGDIRRPNIMWA
jgi:hypothetical protein